jgi:hypothetical protein
VCSQSGPLQSNKKGVTLTVFFTQMFPFGLIPTGLILMLGAAILIGLPAYCGVKIIKMSRERHPNFENWIESLGLETSKLALLVGMAILWLAALVGLSLIAAYTNLQ